jgi:hypothetical protein
MEVGNDVEGGLDGKHCRDEGDYEDGLKTVLVLIYPSLSSLLSLYLFIFFSPSLCLQGSGYCCLADSRF